jgi:hypothetical protein
MLIHGLIHILHYIRITIIYCTIIIMTLLLAACTTRTRVSACSLFAAAELSASAARASLFALLLRSIKSYNAFSLPSSLFASSVIELNSLDISVPSTLSASRFFFLSVPEIEVEDDEDEEDVVRVGFPKPLENF